MSAPVDAASSSSKRNLVGAHDVVGGRRDEQPERGQHPGPERNHDPPDPELRREVAGMQGPGPPEGDERRLPGIAAALRHVHAHGPRHRLVDDVVHGPRRLEHRLPARPGEVLGQTYPTTSRDGGGFDSLNSETDLVSRSSKRSAPSWHVLQRRTTARVRRFRQRHGPNHSRPEPQRPTE